MKESVIMFMSPSCGACQSQKEMLNDYFISRGKRHKLDTVNVDKYPDRFKYIEVLPTWMFILPGGKTCKMKTGVLPPEEIFGGSVKFGRARARRSRFGAKPPLYPGINDSEYYGKEFPNGEGFSIPQSYYQQVESVWGKGDDTLNAGVGGTRSLGPNNITDMYNSSYLNEIRMAHPSDQLGTALYLNRLCNTPPTGSMGMVAGSNSPQIVDNTATSFGRRRTRFGNLYKQMGPASEIGNQYLISKDTGNRLYSGARQFESPRPGGTGGELFISKAQQYNPLNFGKRLKKKTKRDKKDKKTEKSKRDKKDKKSKKSKKTKKTFVVSGRKAVNIKININSKKGKL